MCNFNRNYFITTTGSVVIEYKFIHIETYQIIQVSLFKSPAATP